MSSRGSAIPRVLDLRQAVALGIGGTVGGGIFVLVGQAAGRAGPAALLSFGFAFVAALLIALPYAELSCRYPRAGGGYAFAREVLGERAGFLMGWGYWGAYVFISGYVTLGFGGYLQSLTGVPVVIGAVALVAACTAVNLAGLRVSGRLQLAVVAAAMVGLAAFAAWGIGDVDASRLHPLAPRGVGGIALAALLAFLAFGGFDMVSAAGEEVRRPERNLPRAILITLVSVLALYLAVALVAIGTLGWRALGASPAPLAEAAQDFGGNWARTLVLATALLTTAATANAVLVATSRISFAMARDGLLPARLSATRARSGAPAGAVALNGCLLAAVAVIGSGRFAAAAGGFLYVLHFVPPVVAVAVLRRRPGGVPTPAFQTPAPGMVLALALAACAVLLVAAGLEGAIAGLGWLAVGVLARRASRLRFSAWPV